MYLSHYQLDKKPFQADSDPNFLWMGEKQREALSILRYGVLDNRGFLLLTGDVGTGKTALKNGFVNSLGDKVIVAQVSNPSLTKLGFVKCIAEQYGLDTTFESKDEFLLFFTPFLNQAHLDDKKVLLVIDEAQLLTDELLEELRLLSNIEINNTKLLNILFVGQNEFKDTLENYDNRAIRQRITINFNLDPLELDEIRSCIEHRLEIAGATKKIFSNDAIEAIQQLSDGFPRMINLICDHALLLGFQQDKQEIAAEMVWDCANELQLAKNTNGPTLGANENSYDDLFEESDIPPLDDKTLMDLLKDSAKPHQVNAGPANNDQQTKKRNISHKDFRFPLLAGLLLAVFFTLYNTKDSENPISSFLQKDLSAALVKSPQETSPDISTAEKGSLTPVAEFEEDKTRENPLADMSNSENPDAPQSQPQNLQAHANVASEMQPPTLSLNTNEVKDIPNLTDQIETQVVCRVENGQAVLHQSTQEVQRGSGAVQPSIYDDTRSRREYDSVKMRFKPITIEHRDPSSVIDQLRNSKKASKNTQDVRNIGYVLTHSSH